MTSGLKCGYRFDDGETCQRPRGRDTEHYCIFHSQYPVIHSDIKQFWWRLKRLALKGDGDWRGFNFPRFSVEKISCPVAVDATGASFQNIKLTDVTFKESVDISKSNALGRVDIQRCNFGKRLAFKQIHFLDFNFTHIVVGGEFLADESVFKGDFKATGTFRSRASFLRCHFEKKAHFLSTKSYTLSVSSGILAASTIEGNLVVTKGKSLSHIAKLKESIKSLLVRLYMDLKKAKKKIYRALVSHKERIRQGIKHNINKYREKMPHKRKCVTSYYLFEGQASLDEMTFAEPKEVVFKGVNLQNATFRGTDLRGVTFIGNNWYQPELKRNGLIEDIRLRGINNYYDKKDPLPDLENSYRNIRFSLEANKDFGLANDFFIGEMDAKRNQLPWLKRELFSVLALYRLISNYGTSPIRCLVWFLIVVICHTLIISYLSNAELYITVARNFVDIGYYPSNRISAWFGQMSGGLSELLREDCFIDSIIYSIKTMTLQKDKEHLLKACLEMNSAVSFANTMFSIVGPVLLGLIALTVRTRIKRN